MLLVKLNFLFIFLTITANKNTYKKTVMVVKKVESFSKQNLTKMIHLFQKL